MVVPSIPQEITDSIIDHLYKDTSSLKSCAVVCKSWLMSSRRHLFDSVGITFMNEENSRVRRPDVLGMRFWKDYNMEGLCRFLADSPQVASYVRVLRVDFCMGSSQHPSKLVVRADDLALFSKMAYALNNLGKLMVDTGSSSYPNLDCERSYGLVADSIRQPIEHLIDLPSLHTLRLSGIYLDEGSFYELAKHCRSLKGLELSRVVQGEGGYLENPFSIPKPTDASRAELSGLVYILIEGCYINKISLCIHYLAPNIHELSLVSNHDAAYDARTHLRQLGDSLHHYSHTIYADWASGSKYTHLP
jgi:hypothetical protein